MNKTILLADDSVTIQKVVELTFLDEGYRVVGTANGTDALAKLRDTQPSIVIADIHMPGADGYEVARRVKAERPGTPVLLLVGTFEPFDRERFTASGADAYLKKPFDSQELLRQVANLVGGGARAAEFAPTQVLPKAEDLMPLSSRTSASPAAPPPAPEALETRWESFAIEEFDSEPPTEPLVDSFTPLPTAPGRPMSPPLAAPTPRFQSPMTITPPSGTAIPTPTAPRPAPTATPLPAAAGPAPAPGESSAPRLSELDVDRVARRVIEMLSDKVVREVAWEVVPDLAEVVVKARLREIENEAG